MSSRAAKRAVTDALERLAFAAELRSDPRARTYAAAAWAIRNLDGDLLALRESGELAAVRGIGKSTLKTIDEVLAGEKPKALVSLEAEVPRGLFGIRQIKGLGPKKVKALWQELGVESVAELEYACRENRLLDLKGFGKKTQSSALEEIERLRQSEGLLRRDRAALALEPALAALEALESVAHADVVGDYACGRELVRELAVLVECDDLEEARAAVDAACPRELSITVHGADAESFGARAVWLTSSPGHRRALAARAEERGFVFDESGLRVDGEALGCPEEEDLYRALGLVPTPLERREDHVPLVLAGKATPRLVTRMDLLGALHNHTVASDGSATLAEMRAAATDRGLTYLGITEHSHSAFYARGLDEAQLEEQGAAIAELNEQRSTSQACLLLSGVESDVLKEGELDYGDDVLERLDVVVASVHKRYAQDVDQMTARMVAAASHPYTDIVGHPTGRLLLGRAPSELDMEAFLDACAKNGSAVELNANPARLDLNEIHLEMAKARGVLVSIAADAHATSELDHLETGVIIARRAGLTPEDVLNARTADELIAWVNARRAASRARQAGGGDRRP